MKKLMLAVGLFAVAGSAFAAKPCEELKAEIDAKIKANGVPAYTLEIVDKGSVTDKKVVGTCDEQYPGPAFPWEPALSFCRDEYPANDGSCCSSSRKRAI